jgi:hypothetical protein
MASTLEFRTAHEFAGTAAAGESQASGVSWAAVVAGAFVAAALSLILIGLGTGVGLSSGALWANAGGMAAGIGALIWLIVVEALASATGGYMAGRLRTKWTSVHTHEVYFRDTAHGFLVWAVALVMTAGFLGTAAASMAGSAAAVASSTGATPAAVGARVLDPNQYFADALFRSSAIAADRSDTGFRDQANLILLNGLRKGYLSPEDTNYLSEMVAAKTGVTQQEASQRVAAVFQDDMSAAQDARKTTAHSLYWMFVALLIGAFCASHAATIGGRQRDGGFATAKV